jgi:hypothetical protein
VSKCPFLNNEMLVQPASQEQRDDAIMMKEDPADLAGKDNNTLILFYSQC